MVQGVLHGLGFQPVVAQVDLFQVDRPEAYPTVILLDGKIKEQPNSLYDGLTTLSASSSNNRVAICSAGILKQWLTADRYSDS